MFASISQKCTICVVFVLISQKCDFCVGGRVDCCKRTLFASCLHRCSQKCDICFMFASLFLKCNICGVFASRGTPNRPLGAQSPKIARSCLKNGPVSAFHFAWLILWVFRMHAFRKCVFSFILEILMKQACAGPPTHPSVS